MDVSSGMSEPLSVTTITGHSVDFNVPSVNYNAPSLNYNVPAVDHTAPYVDLTDISLSLNSPTKDKPVSPVDLTSERTDPSLEYRTRSGDESVEENRLSNGNIPKTEHTLTGSDTTDVTSETDDDGMSSTDELSVAVVDHDTIENSEEHHGRSWPIVVSPRRRWPWSRFRRRKRKAIDARKNGDGKNVTASGGATPPTDRKSKLSTLGRIFRPWKWKRKKKSERIEKTAVEIERKISMRTSREELIRKGVIREPDGSQNRVPKIETLKESDDERLAENGAGLVPALCNDSNSAVVDKNPPKTYDSVQGTLSTDSHSNGTTDSNHLPINGVQNITPAPGAVNLPTVTLSSPSVINPSYTPTNNAHSNPTTVPISCSSVMTRPIIVPAGCPSPTIIHTPHPPPPKYTEALAQVTTDKLPPTFQIGVKQVAIVAPQEIHPDRDHGDHRGREEEDEDSEDPELESNHLNKYVIDPDMIHPQSPYEAVLASEPDLSRKPVRSALKKAQSPSPASALNSGSSCTTRPLTPSRATPSPTPGFGTGSVSGLPRHIDVPPTHVSPQSTPTPVGTVRPIPRPRVSIQPVGDNESDKENSLPQVAFAPQEQPDYDNLHDSDDSEDGEIKYKDDDYDPNSLAAKVARNDSLARFLENRPPKDILLAKNIIPEKTDSEKKNMRDAVAGKLTRRLSLRPTQEDLEHRNILPHQTTAEQRAEKERKKRYLIRKLSFRPTIEELRERKIIDFSDYVEVTDTVEYDRKAEKPWTKLTPRDKAAIRKELNEFKSKEMDVHEESRHLTRFHKP